MKNTFQYPKHKNIIIGNIELKNNTLFLDGIPTKNPEALGLAILDYADACSRPVDFDETKIKFINYLENKGLRITTERIKILESLHKTPEPFNIQDVFFFLQNANFIVSKATIYNTLKVLVQAKIINKTNSENPNEDFRLNYFELSVI